MEQASKVSGIVNVEGAPAQRTVRAFGYSATSHTIEGEIVNLSKSLGHATSDPSTGEYTIDLSAGYEQEIFVVAFDDYGEPFYSEATLAAGERIHPTTPNGHVWETTGAGALPVDEPTWVVDTETSQLYGTASMIARPFYRPMVHGPVAPEVTVLVEPTWTPANLFINSEPGAWYDPSDLATLFKDTGAADPVTADGDSVAVMQDKSGLNDHMIQGDPAKRPVYRTDGTKHWLEFNGTSQVMASSNAPWINTATELAVGVAVSVEGGDDYGGILSKGTEGNDSYKGFNIRRTVGNAVQLHGLGSNQNATSSEAFYTVVVYSGIWVSGQTLAIYKNEALADSKAPAANNPDSGSKALTIGKLSYAAFYVAMKFYGAVIIKDSVEANRADIDQYLATKTIVA
jgi:hypothetical protein